MSDISVAESSGTTVTHGHDPRHLFSTIRLFNDASQSDTQVAQPDGEEQALESHEVIELQTFSERKAWIEQKIEFLEKMPPIEVFVGLDAVHASAEEVPGLPTLDELKQSIIEHDAIEKETEIFDRGELTKLRQLTKAATQRNLSPADTDVIELTLTTIYELDKLLHLLRDRSENLELLGIRLTWEQSRIAAWIDRRKILHDLEDFLKLRLRWSPSCYENAVKQDESRDLSRKGSVTSLASTASESSTTGQAFSRSVRFKMAELLSRDAAQFAARVTSLRHGKIAAAGKALDKLIDHSRHPVPDVLLDEQDRLEEKGIKELEQIGKFVMGLVMQWRKADEIYVETMKDKLSAQNLYEEIETAKLYHPTARQCTSFTSRADTLIKRLVLRGNPASPSNTFPRPEHPLFPIQQDSNKALIESLSTEILSATEIAKKVDATAKAYIVGYEAVKHVENLTATAANLSTTFTRILGHLRDGISTGDGDGSPVHLTAEACREPLRHSEFIAFFPSLIQENVHAGESTSNVLRDSSAAMSNLNHPGIDPAFVANAASDFQRLSTLQKEAREGCDNMNSQVHRLREARAVWGVIGRTFEQVEAMRQRVAGAIEHARWRLIPGPTEPSGAENSPAQASIQALGDLHRSQIQLTEDVAPRLGELSQVLEPSPNNWFVQSFGELNSFLNRTIKMAHLLESVQRQASLMRSVHNESSELQMRLQDVIDRVELSTEGVLTGRLGQKEILQTEVQIINTTIGEKVSNFINHLPQRILFVSDQADIIQVTLDTAKKNLLGDFKPNLAVELPMDLASLDSMVRADSNSFVIQLNGKMERLTQAISQFRMACMGQEIDDALQATVTDIDAVHQDLLGWKLRLSDIISQESEPESDVLAALESLLQLVEESTRVNKMRLAGLFSPLHDLLRKLEAAPRSPHDLHMTPRNVIDYAESRYKSWEIDVSTFQDDIRHQQKVERDRLARMSREKEQREEAEKARAAAQEAEELWLEEKRMAFEEEKRRLDEDRRVDELRQQAEMERIADEVAQRERIERERVQAEGNRRLEEERVAEERRLKTQKERVAADEAEKARLRDERLAVEEKLKLVEEELVQERRSRAEKEKLNEKLGQQGHDSASASEHRVPGVVESLELQKAGEFRPQVQGDRLKQKEAGKLRQTGIDENSLEAHRPEAAPALRPRVLQGGATVIRPDIEDVSSLRVALPEGPGKSKEKETRNIRAQILTFRKRLRSLRINEISRPTRLTAVLPNMEQFRKMTQEFTSIKNGVALLPASLPDISVDVELMSLRSEIEASADLMKRVEKLSHFAEDIRACDATLSDLLEHIDSYPALPKGLLSLSHALPTNASPGEQLSARLSTTRATVNNMMAKVIGVAKDSRAIAEKDRVLQTWSELEEMGNDRLGGNKSRPSSVVSSRGSTHRPLSSTPVNSASYAKKKGSYSNLSLSSTSSQKRLLAPPHQPSPRRAVSGSAEPQSRPRHKDRSPTELSSLSSNRSVSGPLGLSIYGSTFASRQRTTSLSNSTSTPTRRVPTTTSARHRTATSQDKRPSSPSGSETSTYVRTHSRSSTSMSSWARAPRDSLSSLVPNISISNTNATPQKRTQVSRKKYVADPKSKLDVAIGDVVNRLPVGINIEGVSETWQDQSGKYWIGNQEPKLCFCRILRSQTVMVRVGGGWSELSKFIKDHFAESFRLIPESPPRPGGTEEKWISSATLLEQRELQTPPGPPRTPEPTVPFSPSYILETPTRSPRSVKSTSPSLKGSPLTPLQFIRRADIDAALRPVTPSKPPILRTRNAAIPIHTSNRHSVWRP